MEATLCRVLQRPRPIRASTAREANRDFLASWVCRKGSGRAFYWDSELEGLKTVRDALEREP